MRSIALALFLIFSTHLQAQENKEYQLMTLGFYNLENLFDTIDQEGVHDTEFSPEGSKNWNSIKYEQKLRNMSTVISMIGNKLDADGVDILGVSEVENRSVLEDLCKEPLLRDRHYQIIHVDSRDFRGIDVALLYNPEHFIPDSFDILEVNLYDENGERKFTRDILYVVGKLDLEEIHLFVNHWPSRRGGEARSSPLREKAASVVREKINEISKSDEDARIFVIGDFNDDPTNKSLSSVLGAEVKKKNVQEGELYNTCANYFFRGIGSNAYRDAWHSFDQIIISDPVLNDRNSYHFYKSAIFRKRFLIQKTGAFKGYPHRTFAGDNFLNGYSDHFPVYIYLRKEVNRK